MQHQPNLIKVAVEAAGGRSQVAKAWNLSPWTITGWQREGRMPVEKIRPLCALGGGVVTPEQLLAYMEQRTTEKVAA